MPKIVEVKSSIFFNKIKSMSGLKDPLQFQVIPIIKQLSLPHSQATVGWKTKILTKKKGIIGTFHNWPRKRYFLYKQIKRKLV